MGIIKNFNAGRMNALRSVNYSETGTQAPYVIKDIKDPPNNNDTTIGLQFNKRIDDTSRIAQMLVDRPGLKFTANQTLLQSSELARKFKNARDNGQTIAGSALASAGVVGKVLGSTLAQVPVNGTGTHFVRGFTPDTYLKEGNPQGVFGFLGFDGNTAASKALNGGTIIQDNVGQSDYKPPIGESSPLEFKISESGTASRFQSTLELSNPDLLDPLKVSVGGKTTQDENNIFTDTERITQLIDYRNLKNKGYRTESYSLDYSDPKINKETRVGLGNQGKKKINISNYTDIDDDRIDKLNAQKPSLEQLDGTGEVRDLINLNFEVITPEENYFLYFRAFLDEFSDSFNADWGSTKYIGRAEDFYTYNGFSRQVSVGFKVAAASRSELNPIYQKIATLASVTTPTYGGIESKFMRGTIARVTIGDYLYKVPGIIDSVDFTWQTDYPWEINMRGPEGEEDTMPVVPHLLDCRISFKPIHDFIPQATFLTQPKSALLRNNPNKSYDTVTTTPNLASLGAANNTLTVQDQQILAGGIPQ